MDTSVTLVQRVDALLQYEQFMNNDGLEEIRKILCNNVMSEAELRLIDQNLKAHEDSTLKRKMNEPCEQSLKLRKLNSDSLPKCPRCNRTENQPANYDAVKGYLAAHTENWDNLNQRIQQFNESQYDFFECTYDFELYFTKTDANGSITLFSGYKGINELETLPPMPMV